MKFSWRNNIPDLAAWNSAQIEELNLDKKCYNELLALDEWADECDKEVGLSILECFDILT